MDHQTRLIEKGHRRMTIWLTPDESSYLEDAASDLNVPKARVLKWALARMKDGMR